MQKNYDFQGSCEVIELKVPYEEEAKNLVIKLQKEGSKNLLIQIDCAPNLQLNPFNYGDGGNSAEIIKKLAGSFLANDLSWLEQNIKKSKNFYFETNFELGEKINFWQKITPNDYQEKINWSQPFCVKNKHGLTKIWHPSWRSFGYNKGFSTRSSIVNFIHENQAYLQDFYMPLASLNSFSSWKMSYRLVFLCETNQDPQFVGGLWISRPGFKIYLGKGSLVGLISPEKTK